MTSSHKKIPLHTQPNISGNHLPFFEYANIADSKIRRQPDFFLINRESRIYLQGNGVYLCLCVDVYCMRERSTTTGTPVAKIIRSQRVSKQVFFSHRKWMQCEPFSLIHSVSFLSTFTYVLLLLLLMLFLYVVCIKSRLIYFWDLVIVMGSRRAYDERIMWLNGYLNFILISKSWNVQSIIHFLMKILWISQTSNPQSHPQTFSFSFSIFQNSIASHPIHPQKKFA